VDCPRVGARLPRGAVGLSSVDLLTVYSYSAAKKSLDFPTNWGADGAVVTVDQRLR